MFRWPHIVYWDRRAALERVSTLIDATPARKFAPISRHARRTRLQLSDSLPREGLHRLCRCSGLSLQPWQLLLLSACSAIFFTFLASQVMASWFLPLFFISTAFIPVSYLKTRAKTRAQDFLSDYPTVLLATASSIKVGLTPANALERATRLLPSSSLVRREVERLIAELRRGDTRNEAVKHFGVDIDLPDLDLFRAAFLLVLENGGRFAPTLERLAAVSKDRAVLIGSARVSTATMRMTANFLLCAAPCIVSLIAARTPDFWDLFLHHPIANKVASAGIVIILGSYALLRRMSDFRP